MTRRSTSSDDPLASLQLPRSNINANSLCLLIVADMDLPSTSALAEAALLDLPKGGTLVDGICACGPFCHEQSLSKYLHQGAAATLQPPSPELTLALEGLVTGCLSQLESIVCRVVWIPSSGADPSTLLNHEHRLTPNSRNIHQQLLPLAPGLACCGLATTTATSTSAANDTNDMVSNLLDLAAPNDEQIKDVKIVSVSTTIVATTGTTTPLERDDRILLHINASNTSTAKPRYEKNVLYPGSLIQRGEYCLLHLAVVPTDGPYSSYRWTVEKVDFRTMEHR